MNVTRRNLIASLGLASVPGPLGLTRAIAAPAGIAAELTELAHEFRAAESAYQAHDNTYPEFATVDKEGPFMEELDRLEKPLDAAHGKLEAATRRTVGIPGAVLLPDGRLIVVLDDPDGYTDCDRILHHVFEPSRVARLA